MTFPQALDAAHILPWSHCTPGQRLDPRNGILLCATHHHLFDAGFLTVDAEFRIIHEDSHNPLDTYTQADVWFTRALHGRKMDVPQLRDHWPGQDYIRARRNLK